MTMEVDTSSDQRPVIQASEILAKIERGEDVEYDGVIVEGELELSVISSQIIITNSKIRGNVKFSNAHLNKAISFKGSEICGYADFRNAKFGKYAGFEGTKWLFAIPCWY